MQVLNSHTSYISAADGNFPSFTVTAAVLLCGALTGEV